MSEQMNLLNETPPPNYPAGYSRPPEVDGLLNGEVKYNNYLPNNNICESVVSSCVKNNCANQSVSVGKVLRRTASREFDTEEEFESKDESDTYSGIPSEDTNSINDGSTTDSQTELHPDPYTLQVEEEKASPLEHHNGELRKNNGKKKKLASGPGRGRPKKALVPMYQSQISGDKNAIKIRIKKSSLCSQVQLPPNKKKTGRRKKHKLNSDTDASDSERRGNKKIRNVENDVSSTQEQEPLEQSGWGDCERLPQEVLQIIFHYVCGQDGCLPTLVRLARVCKYWRDVSLLPALWLKADLNYVKEHLRTDLRLHWLILNRLTHCQEINFGEWKVRDIQAVLEALCEHCNNLRGLNLSGWKGLNADNLKYLTNECKKLERLDLSSVNSTSAINAQPLVLLSQAMASRLTHLVLAHNKIAGFTQIIASIATHCPNLQLLDISNIRTFAHNTALLHVEKLQIGCPNLRVLRITNSQIWLAPTSLTEQVASPGFPKLEELSLAGIEEDKTTTSRSMDDEGIERLLKTSKKLRLLDVRGCCKLTDSGLVRVPAWDLEHLFLSACYITRLQNSDLELIIRKWSHSLLEVDLAWSTATKSLDAAVFALAEKGSESKLRVINLCGSSVSLEPVKALLTKCQNLHSINLQSCRALPRGIKRLYTGRAVAELRSSLLDKPKTDVCDSENEQSPAHAAND